MNRRRKGHSKSRRASAENETIEVEVVLHPDAAGNDAEIRRMAARAANIAPQEIVDHRVTRRAIDARRGTPRIRATVMLGVGVPLPPSPLLSPESLPSPAGAPVVIIGGGPAGMFCALGLARRGQRCILLERGKPVRARRRDLAALTQRGTLDADSNYCFGEGGAGTFSDGKLYTRSKKRGEIRDILETLVRYGAPQDILVNARPHIGTNRLPKVVSAMRKHLEDAGVSVRFEARADALETVDGRVCGVILANGEQISAAAVVLAPGHSAGEIVRAAADAGAELTSKPFAMGVRIEHPQDFIDKTQFGTLAGHCALGAASYRLVEQVDGAGVFSFCMCPGGVMVPASTIPGQQVVNGWSPARRKGRFANSGFVTEVGPSQLRAAGLNPDDLTAGLQLQERLECRAFAAGGGDYIAPAQTLRDFVEGTTGHTLPSSSYHRGLHAVDLSDVLGPLAPPLREALKILATKMPGFVSHDAVAVGVESRTSSPVRLVRDRDTLESKGLAGLYPCGEGAGYAGGIISAALDGVHVAAALRTRGT